LPPDENIVSNILAIIRNRSSMRIYHGAITLFKLYSQGKEFDIPLYEWENPFVLAKFRDPELQVENAWLRHGKKLYQVKKVRKNFEEELLSEIIFDLETEKGEKAILTWDGREILLFTIFRAHEGLVSRELEILKTVSLPFKLAVLLNLSGRDTIDGRRIIVSRHIVKVREPSDILSRDLQEMIEKSVLEKILHPLHLFTDDITKIEEGLRDVINRDALLLRLAAFILHVVGLATLTANQVTNNGWEKLSESQKERILRETARIYWIQKPLLRMDPLCPPQKKFTNVVINVWKRLKSQECSTWKEFLPDVVKLVEREIDVTELILSLKQ